MSAPPEGVWASDVPISIPAGAPPDRPVMVDFGGFAFTTAGINHNLTAADKEALLTPFFAPRRTLPSPINNPEPKP